MFSLVWVNFLFPPNPYENSSCISSHCSLAQMNSATSQHQRVRPYKSGHRNRNKTWSTDWIFCWRSVWLEVLFNWRQRAQEEGPKSAKRQVPQKKICSLMLKAEDESPAQFPEAMIGSISAGLEKEGKCDQRQNPRSKYSHYLQGSSWLEFIQPMFKANLTKNSRTGCLPWRCSGSRVRRRAYATHRHWYSLVSLCGRHSQSTADGLTQTVPLRPRQEAPLTLKDDTHR